MTKEQFTGVLRHILTFAGGVAVSKGLIDESVSVEVVGAIVTLAGVVWSFVAKQGSN